MASRISYFTFLILIFFLISCSNNHNTFEQGLSSKDWICDSKNLTDTLSISYTHSKELFRIQTPYGYWTNEDLLDTIYGLVTVDTIYDYKNTTGISILVLSTNGKTYFEYIENEYNIFRDRETISLLEYGKSTKFENCSYWFLIESEEPDSLISLNYLIYIDNKNANTVSLLHSFVYGDIEREKRLCRLKEYLYTFEKL